jgi:hypothetical protein
VGDVIGNQPVTVETELAVASMKGAHADLVIFDEAAGWDPPAIEGAVVDDDLPPEPPAQWHKSPR